MALRGRQELSKLNCSGDHPSPQRQSSMVPQTLTRSRPDVPAPVAGSKRKQSDVGLSKTSPTRKLQRRLSEDEILEIGGDQISQEDGDSAYVMDFQEDDDAASMASSVDSLDSNADLLAAGVPIRDIKAQVISKMVKNIDNSSMLRIQHELKTILREEKWMKLVEKIPFAAGALKLVFLDHDEYINK